MYVGQPDPSRTFIISAFERGALRLLASWAATHQAGTFDEQLTIR